MAVIFFDFDGVLVDSLEVETGNFVQACHMVGIEGIETSKDMAKLSEGNFYDGMLAMGIPSEKIQEAMKHYAEMKKDPAFYVPSNAPMMKLVKRLAKKFPLYIITSNVSLAAEKILELNGVKGIKAILGADVETSKIKKIHSVMELYPGERTLFVGDTKGDMVESKEAGIDTRLAVTWGWQDPWVVASGNPDYIFDKPSQIKTWFKGFMNGVK